MKSLNKIMLLLILVASLLMAIGCEKEVHEKNEAVANEKLADTIIDETKVDASNEDRYIYFYQDLNGDKKDEIIAYLWGPDFSGSGGATMLIFNEEYKLISRTTLVSMPIIISENKTNGYNDIIVTVSGGGLPSVIHTILKFENGQYPLNSSNQPEVDLNNVKPLRTIEVDINPEKGFKL